MKKCAQGSFEREDLVKHVSRTRKALEHRPPRSKLPGFDLCKAKVPPESRRSPKWNHAFFGPSTSTNIANCFLKLSVKSICNIRSCFADSQNGGCHVTSLAEVNKMESVLTILDLKGGVLIYELLCWFTELDFTDHRSWTGLLNPNSTVRTSEPSQNRF